MSRLFGVVLGAVLVVSGAAGAQQPGRAVDTLQKQLLKLALDNLDQAICDKAKCTPATDEERRNPPLSDDQVKAIISVGTLSTLAEHCGLDWKRRNFQPLMQIHRKRMKMSERQVALAGLLHGITMGVTGNTIRSQPCTQKLKAEVDQKLILK